MPSPRFLDPSSIPLKRQSGGSIWATLLPVLQWAIIIALLSVVGLFFLPVIQKVSQQKAEIAKIQVKTNAALDQQAQLKLQTELMKNNPAYVEHIARDKLSMGKPGETIIRFDKYQSESSNSSSTDSDSSDSQ